MKFESDAGKNKHVTVAVPAAIPWTLPSRNGINAPVKTATAKRERGDLGDEDFPAAHFHLVE
jgi:hypothetical protein